MALNEPSGQPEALKANEFVSKTQTNLVTFASKDVDPPSRVYLQRDDNLVVTILSAILAEFVTVTARLWLAAEDRITTIQFQTRAVAAAYTPLTAFVNMAEGYLLSVTVNANSASQLGQTHCVVFVNRGNPTSGTNVNAGVLINGYVTNGEQASWPDSTPQRPGAENGSRRIIPVNPTAAGADWNFTVENGAMWEVISIVGQFAASAAAANRQIQLSLTDGLRLLWNVPSNVNVTAAQVAQWSAYQALPPAGVPALDVFSLVPPRNMLRAGDIIQSSTANIQAGDQWSAVVITAREWTTFS